jgi:hypothetical protein
MHRGKLYIRMDEARLRRSEAKDLGRTEVAAHKVATRGPDRAAFWSFSYLIEGL